MNIYELQFKRHWLKAYLLSAVWILLVALLWIIIAHDYFSDRISPSASIFIALILSLIPIFRSKLWRCFTDRSFTGTVIEVRHKETLTSSKDRPSTPTATDPLYHIMLKVELPDGSIKKMHIESREPLYHDLWYHKGDTVTYHRGTKFPLIHGGRRVCATCGTEYIYDDPICRTCGKINE